MISELRKKSLGPESGSSFCPFYPNLKPSTLNAKVLFCFRLWKEWGSSETKSIYTIEEITVL